MHLSRGFLAALGGVGMTLLAWFGSLAWPGWPAGFAMDVIERYASFPDFPRGIKMLTIVGLITINVGTWGLILRGAMQIVRRRRPAMASAATRARGPEICPVDPE